MVMAASASINFRDGEYFHGGGAFYGDNTYVTLLSRMVAATMRPRRSQFSTGDRQTNKQTNKQMDINIA